MYSYTVDDLENAIDYLEQANFFYSNSDYKHRFKWLTISLHGALYGFCVVAVKGSNPTSTVFKPIDKVIKNPSRLRELREKISETYGESDSEYIDMYIQRFEGDLLSIYALLKKCQDKELMGKFTDSKVLEIDKETENSIKIIVDWRNDFAHFQPKTKISFNNHSLDFIRVFKVIRFLALESNNVLYFSGEDKKRVEKIFEKLDLDQ